MAPMQLNGPLGNGPIQLNGGPATSSCGLNIGNDGDSDPFTYNFYADPHLNIGDYAWSIDTTPVTAYADVDPAGQTYSHRFDQAGTYTVTLVCNPNNGDPAYTQTGTITIVSNPVASFSVSPGTTGNAPYTVYIVDQSSGGQLNYQWTVVDANAADPKPTDL
jgi:PKD repeat protein